MFRFEKVKRFDGIEIKEPARKTKNAAGYDMVAAETVVIPPLGNLQNSLANHIIPRKLPKEVEELAVKMSKDNPSLAQQMIDTALECGIEELSGFTKETGCKPTLISTGYKAYMPEDYSLDLYIRSSSPLKYWIIMANSTGIIDSDYADNEDNEGEIFFQVINLSPVPVRIEKGDIIGQAKFVKFEKTVNDELTEKEDRSGGFGSTTDIKEEDVVE